MGLAEYDGTSGSSSQPDWPLPSGPPATQSHTVSKVYVTGDTEWEQFTHQEMYTMLFEHADPETIQDAAQLWHHFGDTLEEVSHKVKLYVAILKLSWTGEAADHALAVLDQNVTWIAKFNVAANRVAELIKRSADQLAVARRDMPNPNTLPPASGERFRTTDDPAGTPSSWLLGSVTEAAADFTAIAEAKKQAISVMREHEEGAEIIDHGYRTESIKSDSVWPGTTRPVAPYRSGATPASLMWSESRAMVTNESFGSRIDVSHEASKLTASPQTAPAVSTSTAPARWGDLATSASSSPGSTGLAAGSPSVGPSPAVAAATSGLAVGSGFVPRDQRNRPAPAPGAYGSTSQTNSQAAQRPPEQPARHAGPEPGSGRAAPGPAARTLEIPGSRPAAEPPPKSSGDTGQRVVGAPDARVGGESAARASGEAASRSTGQPVSQAGTEQPRRAGEWAPKAPEHSPSLGAEPASRRKRPDERIGHREEPISSDQGAQPRQAPDDVERSDDDGHGWLVPIRK